MRQMLTAESAGPEPDQSWVTMYLGQVIADFQSDPRTPQLIRCLAKEYPDLFFTAAAKVLESEGDSSARRFLAGLMLRQKDLFVRLTNPARFSRKSAVGIFKSLLSVDAFLDFKLARLLPGRDREANDGALSGKNAARAIDILDQTSPGQRLASIMGHLPNSEDEHIASKAALFVGHRVSNPTWLAKHVVREEPRLRASVVESAWGTKSEAAIQILEDCTHDDCDRVAGNALIGLHMAGRPDVAERTLEMSWSEKPGRRSTAAWAMGKIGHGEFLARLTELMRDENPKVRSTALRSLAEIGRAEATRPKIEAPQIVEPEPVSEEPSAPETPAMAFELRLDGSNFKARKQ